MNEPSKAKPDFPTPGEAAADDAWFRAKVEASLANPEPGTPHDVVMARVQAIIDEAKAKQAG